MNFMARIFCLSICCSSLAFASANPTNDSLLTLSPQDQADTMGQAAGNGCVGKSAMYMGTVEQGPDINDALWSVACDNGKSYRIKLLPNSNGDTKATECSELKAESGISCFQKLQ